MNEQKKELMLWAASKSKDGKIQGAVINKDGEFILIPDVAHIRVSDIDAVTPDEVEGFIESLFEGAPEDAEYIGMSNPEEPAWLKFSNGLWKWYFAGLWRVCGDGYESGEYPVIPRPRKQEVERAEWSGEGLPPVGTVCEVLFSTFDDTWNKAKIIAHDNERIVGRWLSGNREEMLFDYEIDMLPNAYRPLKTEAEKVRERLEGLLCVMDSIGTWDVKGDTLEESVCDTFGENTWQELCEVLRLGIKVKLEATK